ncbi:MAG TPA: hypothetical protein VL337_17405 [Acidimicrobiales bacterium]|nr:hypothetical protein [Acidimicrobiales bacterium]
MPDPSSSAWAVGTPMLAGGAEPARSRATSSEATPRTIDPGAPPHATTTKVVRSPVSRDTSTCNDQSRAVWAGWNSWKSFSDSPTNSSTRLNGVGADARPFTVTTPRTVVAAAGAVMVTVPASASVVGQVLGKAAAGPAPRATDPRSRTAPSSARPASRGPTGWARGRARRRRRPR